MVLGAVGRFEPLFCGGVGSSVERKNEAAEALRSEEVLSWASAKVGVPRDCLICALTVLYVPALTVLSGFDCLMCALTVLYVPYSQVLSWASAKVGVP